MDRVAELNPPVARESLVDRLPDEGMPKRVAGRPLLQQPYLDRLYNLAFILPTPPGQVGSNELIGLLIFSGLFGVNRSGVGAMFLFSHPWTALLMTCSGLLCLSTMGLTLRATMRLARVHEEVQEA